MAAEIDLVKTGILGLDSILGGGIPRGNVIVVEGPAGSGKTTLGLDYIYRGAAEFNEPGLIVLFEVSPLKVIRDASQFGWDLAELERQGKIKIIFTTRSVLQQELQQADSLLLAEAGEIGARRMFIDSMPPLPSTGHNGSNGQNGVDSREVFHTLVQGLHRENLTAMLAVEAPGIERIREAVPPIEEFIADSIIVLRIDDLERAASRSIEIVKSRGHGFQMGTTSFRIGHGRGIEVYRRVQAPREASRDPAAAFDPTTRVSSGVPGLDEMVNGGYFLGSTTVVSGISASARASWGCITSLRARAAASEPDGEPGRASGTDHSQREEHRHRPRVHIDHGLIRLQYDAPQEIEIDRHFHQIEQIIEDFKPKRVVIDSLSTYGPLWAVGRVFQGFLSRARRADEGASDAAVYNHENPEIWACRRWWASSP